MFDDLFGDWPEAFPDTPARIQVRPPRPVDVDLGAILPADPHATRSTILRIRAACLDLTGTTGNRRGHLPMRQWDPARAVRPK